LKGFILLILWPIWSSRNELVHFTSNSKFTYVTASEKINSQHWQFSIDQCIQECTLYLCDCMALTSLTQWRPFNSPETCKYNVFHCLYVRMFIHAARTLSLWWFPKIFTEKLAYHNDLKVTERGRLGELKPQFLLSLHRNVIQMCPDNLNNSPLCSG